MLHNKEIIVRIIIGTVFFIIFVKVVGPVIFEVLKGKIPGPRNPDNDIDHMIKRQKERLRAQYGITGCEVGTITSVSSNLVDRLGTDLSNHGHGHRVVIPRRS